MKTLRWLLLVPLVACFSVVACGEDDESEPTSAGGSGGATGGTAGSAMGGMAGSATGGMAGSATGGMAGSGDVPPMDNPCVKACLQDNADAWESLVGFMAPCQCEEKVCGSQCDTTMCADPMNAELTADCGNCALEKAETNCSAELGKCLNDATCRPVAMCLLACKSG